MFTVVIAEIRIGPTPKQRLHGFTVAAGCRAHQCGRIVLVARVHIRPRCQQRKRDIGATARCGPMEGCFATAGPSVHIDATFDHRIYCVEVACKCSAIERFRRGGDCCPRCFREDLQDIRLAQYLRELDRGLFVECRRVRVGTGFQQDLHRLDVVAHDCDCHRIDLFSVCYPTVNVFGQ